MTLKINLLSSILMTLLALAPAGTTADVYVWTDQNGIRHYSNISPPLNGDIRLLKESSRPLPEGIQFKVTHVYDGDTVQVSGKGLTFRIRLAGIDTPEKGKKEQPGQPYAQKALQTLKSLVEGKDIRIKQYGTGGYNRMLAEIYVHGDNINLAMIQKGLAEVYRGKPPETLDIDAYKRAQNEARSKQIGIWSLGKRYKSPRQWRKENPWK